LPNIPLREHNSGYTLKYGGNIKMEVEVNYLAVLLAAASSMVVGMIWYAKPVFGADWQHMVKLSDKEMKDWAPFALVVAFVSSLVMAYVLANVAYLSNSFFALWLWLGFIGIRIFMHDQFEHRRKKLSIINAGNELATIMVMALIIGLMQP
jgi:hypothetical protein